MKKLGAFILAAASAYLNYQLNDSILCAILAFIFAPVYLLYWLFVHGLAGGVINAWFASLKAA
ncbi:hypothetical protein [Xanthomonas phage SB4]|uniref:Uncharacterized protein n=1 Tax=Xanthomonas phage SB4 TaxID=3117473 RepID=A0ABZ2GVQ8_9CAUD